MLGILLSVIMNYLFLHFSMQFYAFCFKGYLSFREKYVQNWCQGLQPRSAVHFLCFWCYLVDKLLILGCYAHGCRAVLTCVGGEEKIQFLSIFRSALLMCRGDTFLFQNKKLHLDLHVQIVTFKFYMNTLQKSFESADYE